MFVQGSCIPAGSLQFLLFRLGQEQKLSFAVVNEKYPEKDRTQGNIGYEETGSAHAGVHHEQMIPRPSLDASALHKLLDANVQS